MLCLLRRPRTSQANIAIDVPSVDGGRDKSNRLPRVRNRVRFAADMLDARVSGFSPCPTA